MHDETLRCDFCRGPIPAQDLLHGRAVIVFQKKYCKGCMTVAIQKGRNHAEARAAAPAAAVPRAPVPAPVPRETVPAAVAREEVESALPREAARAETPPPKSVPPPPPPKAVPAPQAICRLNVGEHGCGFYSSEEDRRHQLGPYLREGLENNEKILHFLRNPTPEKILGDFRAAGVSPKQYLDRGQAVIVPVGKILDAAGNFDPAAVTDRILQAADRALEDGYSRLRIAGEMTWSLNQNIGIETMVEYEKTLTDLAARGKCTALCQYNVYRFDTESLGMIRKSHPYVFAKGTAAMVMKELTPPV